MPVLATETIELQVQFHDLDPANIVWHGNYVRYLALARDALMNRIGYGHAAMFESGYLFPITDIRLRFLQASRLDQRILVTAQLIEADPLLRFRYAVCDQASGRRLLRAASSQAAVEARTGQLLHRAPEPLLRCLGSLSHG